MPSRVFCTARWGRGIAWALALGFGLAGGGCYTLLNHPGVGDPVAAEEGYSGECLRCHAATGAAEIGVTPWTEYWRASRAGWINYYGSPHWLDWRWAHTDDADTTQTRTAPSARAAWGRMPLHPAGSSGIDSRLRSPSGTSPSIPGPTAGGAATAPAVVAPAEQPPAQSTTPEQEEEKPKTLPESGRGLRR